MSGLLLSLLAGTVVAANPVTQPPWFSFEDYPMKAFEKKWEGVTRFELLISPDGSIASCKILSSSGHEELDRTTCFLSQKRAKFQPARSTEGQQRAGLRSFDAGIVAPGGL